MADAQPHKPALPSTRRILKGAAPPPPPGQKGPPSTVARHVESAHTKTRKHEPPSPYQGAVEVVTTRGEGNSTKVRARVRGDVAVHGMGLRQKIMIAMASVTIVTAILIFIVVYVKATGQLSDEIDSKGIAQARLMASIDPEIWMAAMYQDPVVRDERMTDLIHRFDPEWNADVRGRFFQVHADLRDVHENLLRGSIGEARRRAAEEFFKTLVERRKTELVEDDDKERLEKNYYRLRESENFQRDVRALFDPFGQIEPLRAGGVNLLDSGEIVQLSVLDVTRGVNPDASVQATPKVKNLSLASDKRFVRGLEVSDGYVKEENIPVRSFKLDSPEMETSVGKVKLQYWVLLSLRHIEDAKGTLRTIIFLPIFLVVVVGLAIAWWISERISEPVRLLMDDINAVSGGDLDHETIAHSTDEVGQLAMTFNRMTQALKAAHNQELEQKAVEHELNIASEIQANLVPKKMLKIPGFEISAYYRPSKEVGGDYYDFIEIDEDYYGFIVADVSGKGVPGALVMSMARAFIRMEADRARNISPSDTLKRANKMLAVDIKKGMFVTAMYCIVNKRTAELAVSSAGHNPLVLWRAATNEVQLINPKGIALGFDKGPVFDRTVAEERVQLQPGDRAVLCTDGVVEAMNKERDEFGDKRFHALVQQLATRDSNQFLNLVIKALDEHKGDAPQHDDITLVTFRYVGGV
ncbi:MAG: SpoIIE family protein phosphatase [Planctomycetes bacterium]|nr:SpoIIE family protein phosphatase [Planctomycetota bacterium]